MSFKNNNKIKITANRQYVIQEEMDSDGQCHSNPSEAQRKVRRP